MVGVSWLSGSGIGLVICSVDVLCVPLIHWTVEKTALCSKTLKEHC